MPAGKMNSEQINQLLEKALYGRLGILENDYPYIVPVCFLYHEGKIYFHSRVSGKKMTGLKKNPAVCIQVDEISDLVKSSLPCDFNVSYKSVIIQGRAVVIEDNPAKKVILSLIAEKFAAGMKLEPLNDQEVENTAVIEVTIETISGKGSSV